MHKPDFALENEMPKILWDFEIQKDHLVIGEGVLLLCRNEVSVSVYCKKKKKIKKKRNQQK